MTSNRSLEFFEQQFRRQVSEAEYVLNPFERAILPHLFGDVLDLGCGLGNLSVSAAQAGYRVTALDASPAGIEDLARRAREGGLRIEARVADLRQYVPPGDYDCVVAIGLFMFLRCDDARAMLARARDAVRPGGIAAVNVLVGGTTYMAMFDPDAYCLFGRDELSAAFSDWTTVLSRHGEFPASGNTVKCFHTLVARRPATEFTPGTP